MGIETKFNINDDAWFVHPTSLKAVSGKVREIKVEITSETIKRTGNKRDLINTGEYKMRGIFINYLLDDNVRKEGVLRRQSDVFSSKDELKQTMLNKVNQL